MEPNASTDDRNSAVRSPRPPSTSALLPPAPPTRRCRDGQGGSGGRVSRLRTRDWDDIDVTLQSVISQSGERSVQMPREGAGITPYDLAYEGPNGAIEQEAKQEDSPDASAVMYLPISVTKAERGARPSQEDMEPITEAERGRKPSPQDKKAGARLELALSREADEDIIDSREVSGSNPLPTQAVAPPQGGEQRSMSPFRDKSTTHNLELATAREQGPEYLVGRRGAVLPAATVEEHPHDGANQHDTFLQVHPQRIAPTALVEGEQQEFTVKENEHAAHPGAYPVDGILARNDTTKECHHQHKTTLPYVFFDFDKMANHYVVGFVVFLWLLCGVVAQPQKGPRKGVLTGRGKLSRFREEEDCLFCLIQAVDIDFDDALLSDDDDGFEFECLRKSEQASRISSEIPFQIDLPQEFVDEHATELQSGLSTVCVRGGTIEFPNATVPGQVVIPEGAELELIAGGQETDEDEELGLGNRTVLVVRVLGTGESPDETVQGMQGAVFGLGRQPLANSMNAQFGRCSFSKIDFLPASGFDQFDNGVLNIQLNSRLQGREALGVMVDATDAVKAILGVEFLEGSFDHIIFCIARGTTSNGRSDWTAFATVNGWRSVFNSGRCDSLSYLMHEIGHNLGLVHSADDFVGNSYGDTTGMMGLSEPTVDGPLKCFNPSKNWHLGWYKDKALPVGQGESWSGRLVSFVDYELADLSKNEVVLLRLGDFLFVQYNRAKDFNAGTSPHRDKVVVAIGAGGLTSSKSVLRAGLGPRESSSWKGTTIQVCALGFDASSGVDYAEVSVHPTGSASACTFAPTLSPFGTGPTSELPTASPMATSAAPVTERPATDVSVRPTTTGAPSSFLDQCEVGGQYYGITPPTYRLNTTVPEGSWDGDVSMHDPSYQKEEGRKQYEATATGTDPGPGVGVNVMYIDSRHGSHVGSGFHGDRTEYPVPP